MLSGKFANFRTMTDGETARNFDYDYNSIMHYGPYFFRFKINFNITYNIPLNIPFNITLDITFDKTLTTTTTQ